MQWTERWRERAVRLALQWRTAYRVLKHPRTPWTARLVAALATGYVISPVQLIPSFIPVIGQLDDAAVLWAGTKLIRRLTPPALLEECQRGNAGRRPVRNAARPDIKFAA